MEYKLDFNGFKQGLKEGKLLGLKCNKCGGFTCPPRKVCAECGSEDMAVATLSGNGEIQTFTVIFVTPEGFKPPVAVGVAKLEEGPWVMGNIEGLEPDKINIEIIGRKVKVGYKDVPADMFSAGERIAMTLKLV